MFFNPVYLLVMLPPLALAFWARQRVVAAYLEANRVPASSGYSGSEAADAMLRSSGIHHVVIEGVPGQLSDHYAAGDKMLQLSEGTHDGRSLAAVAAAAHEAGHALQEAEAYPRLGFRNAVVPLANIGSAFAWIMIAVGLVLFLAGPIYVGIAVFWFTVLLQAANLPAEFDASRRAKVRLLETGIVTPAEEKELAKALRAAALTHVAATLTSIPRLVAYLYRAATFWRR